MSFHGICACSHKLDAPAPPRPAPRASSPRACRGRQEMQRTWSTQHCEFFSSNCCTRHQPLGAASVGAWWTAVEAFLVPIWQRLEASNAPQVAQVVWHEAIRDGLKLHRCRPGPIGSGGGRGSAQIPFDLGLPPVLLLHPFLLFLSHARLNFLRRRSQPCTRRIVCPPSPTRGEFPPHSFHKDSCPNTA